MLIGIDVGTSFLKGGVLNPATFDIRHLERVPFPEFLPELPAGHREVDTSLILNQVELLLEALLPHAADCEAIMFSGQMHGFVIQGTNTTSNYISWLDQRSQETFADLRRRIGDDAYQRLGNELRPGIALTTVFWLNQQRPLQNSTVSSLPAYIAARLCHAEPCEEPTQAAALGMMDLTTMAWDRQLMAQLGLEALTFPSLRPYTRPIGHWRGIPVYPAVGDQQCSLAGTLLQPGELSINVSTGSQMATLATTLAGGRHQTRPYFDGQFLRTITHLPAGRALDGLHRLFSSTWEEVEAAVRATLSTDLRANLCFFPGPFGDRGSLANLHEGNMTLGHVFRAAFESMAGNYHQAAHWLDAASPSAVVFSGGLVQKNDTLRDLILQAFPAAPHRLAPLTEDAMMGLLLLGAVATGRYASLHDASKAATRVY